MLTVKVYDFPQRNNSIPYKVYTKVLNADKATVPSHIVLCFEDRNVLVPVEGKEIVIFNDDESVNRK
jgi:hypothetical protein